MAEATNGNAIEQFLLSAAPLVGTLVGSFSMVNGVIANAALKLLSRVLLFVYMQFVPAWLLTWLRRIEPGLPYVDDDTADALETIFSLYYHIFKDMRHWALIHRSKVDTVIEELDDYIDDFDLMRKHGDEWQTTIEEIERLEGLSADFDGNQPRGS